MNGRGRGISFAPLVYKSNIKQAEPPRCAEDPNILQITKFRKEIIDKISKNHVTLISAETGSGKV